MSIQPVEQGGPGSGNFKWAGVTEDNWDTCHPLELPTKADKTVQVDGSSGSNTFGGGNVPMQGSIMLGSGPVYGALDDPQGVALAITSAKPEAILQNVPKVKPGQPTGTSVLVDIYIQVN